jgi:hypothetical protein
MGDYSDQYDDLEEKDILIGILTELQQMRMMMQAQQTAGSDDTATYSCDRCNATVPEDKRVAHARDAHKTPPGMADEIFTRVD